MTGCNACMSRSKDSGFRAFSIVEKRETDRFINAAEHIIAGCEVSFREDQADSLLFEINVEIGGHMIRVMDYISMIDRESCDREIYKNKYKSALCRFAMLAYDYSCG